MFLLDEMALAMHQFAQEKQNTLYLMFLAQILIDINFTLGSTAKRGLAQLRAESARMLKVVQERERVEPRTKPPEWPQEREDDIAGFVHEASLWTAPDDPVTMVRKKAAGGLGAGSTETLYSSQLMPRNALMCGVILLRLQLMYRTLALHLSSSFGSILYSAHLLTACRLSGNAPGQAGPA